MPWQLALAACFLFLSLGCAVRLKTAPSSSAVPAVPAIPVDPAISAHTVARPHIPNIVFNGDGG